MAWYGGGKVRYRGRLVYVTTRYGEFDGANVIKGKPLKLTPRDIRRIAYIFERQNPNHAEEDAPRPCSGCGRLW